MEGWKPGCGMVRGRPQGWVYLCVCVPVGVTQVPSPKSPGLGTWDGSDFAFIDFGWFNILATTLI